MKVCKITREPTCNVYASTDASDTHGGVWLKSHYFHYKFRGKDKKKAIVYKEAHAALMLIHNFKNELTGKRLKIFVDNTNLYHGLRRKWSTTREVMIYIFEICLLGFKHNIEVWVDWISSESNLAADALSRDQISKFREWASMFGELDDEETDPDYYTEKMFSMPKALDFTTHCQIEFKRFKKWLQRQPQDREERWWLTAKEKEDLFNNLEGKTEEKHYLT